MDKQHNITDSFCLKLLIIGLFIISTGCNALPGTGEDRELLPIEEGVRFTVTETQDQGSDTEQPSIQLEMETVDDYSCLGYGIVSDLSQSRSVLEVDIKGVVEPGGPCAAALGPARNRFTLDVTPGEYALIFKYAGESYAYQLTVTDSSVEVTGDESSFISPK